MDILTKITDKLATLANRHLAKGVQAVLEHIRIAEEHYSQASDQQNSAHYSDVIYRTNQAFEGILKVTYSAMVWNSGGATPSS